MTDLDRRHARREELLAALLIAGVPLLSLALGRGALQSPDGLSYLSDLRDGIDLVHPHHALYGPLLAVASRLLAPLGCGPLAAGQVLGLVVHILALGAGWRFARARLAPGAALAALALLAALRGLPLYAVRLEVYLPQIAAAAWLAVVCLGARPAAAEPWRAPAAAGLLALAALSHQMGALLALPVLANPWARRRTRALVVGAAGAVTLAGYAAGWAWGRPSNDADAFASWLTAYAHAGVDGWGTFAYWSPGGAGALLANLARMLAPVPAGLGTPAALAAGTLVLAVAAAAWRRGRGADDPAAPATARFLVLWLGAQLAFSLWWLPLDSDFAVPAVWPLWAAAVAAAGTRPPARLIAATAALALVLGVVNLGWGLPRLARAGAAERARIMALDPAAPRSDDYGEQQHLRWYRDLPPEPERGRPAP